MAENLSPARNNLVILKPDLASMVEGLVGFHTTIAFSFGATSTPCMWQYPNSQRDCGAPERHDGMEGQ